MWDTAQVGDRAGDLVWIKHSAHNSTKVFKLNRWDTAQVRQIYTGDHNIYNVVKYNRWDTAQVR